MATTRKQLYKKMSTYESSAAYQDILRDTYKRSVKKDIYNVCSIFIYILLMICIGLQFLWGGNLISVRTLFITIGITLSLAIPNIILCDILDFTIDLDVLNYLNDIAQQNYEIIENDNAHVLKENGDILRIVVDGTMLKQKFPFQASIDKYQVQTRKYFVINEKGRIHKCTDHVLICDGQIVQEKTGL